MVRLMKIIYCFDAYCGWCYGFTSQMKKLVSDYAGSFHFEVLSGGMILPEKPVHIRQTAGYINKSYRRVEEVSGVKFGEDYLWHIKHPEESDWYPHSEKPAIALIVFKEYHPAKQVEIASDIQSALHAEGRDLCDDEAYRHLLQRYKIPETEFYNKLHDPSYKESAYGEFEMVKRLQVTGYPTVLVQANENKFYLLARGYTAFETMKERLETILKMAETVN
jgi:putative protein-disulfide isomerase